MLMSGLGLKFQIVKIAIFWQPRKVWKCIFLHKADNFALFHLSYWNVAHSISFKDIFLKGYA